VIRGYVFARANLPQAVILVDPYYLWRGPELMLPSSWVVLENIARVLKDVTFSGQVAVGATGSPRLESKGYTGLVFEQGRRRVIVLLSSGYQKGTLGGRFVPRLPGVLWEWRESPEEAWSGRLNWDARPMQLEQPGTLCIYEELIPVQVE
jgi:hypothetical protein